MNDIESDSPIRIRVLAKFNLHGIELYNPKILKENQKLQGIKFCTPKNARVLASVGISLKFRPDDDSFIIGPYQNFIELSPDLINSKQISKDKLIELQKEINPLVDDGNITDIASFFFKNEIVTPDEINYDGMPLPQHAYNTGNFELLTVLADFGADLSEFSSEESSDEMSRIISDRLEDINNTCSNSRPARNVM